MKLLQKVMSPILVPRPKVGDIFEILRWEHFDVLMNSREKILKVTSDFWTQLYCRLRSVLAQKLTYGHFPAVINFAISKDLHEGSRLAQTDLLPPSIIQAQGKVSSRLSGTYHHHHRSSQTLFEHSCSFYP